MKGGNFHRVLDALDDSLSKQRSAKHAPPPKESKAEAKAETKADDGDGDEADCPHCGGSGKKSKGGHR